MVEDYMEFIHVLYVGISIFVYCGFTSLSTLQIITQQVVGRAEETSTYSWSRFCIVNCLPTASNYLLSYLRSGRDLNSDLRGGRRVCLPLHHCGRWVYLYPRNVDYRDICRTLLPCSGFVSNFLPQVTMLRTCSNMTQAVEWDVKLTTLTDFASHFC